MKEGHFMCPQCAIDKPYKHKKVTRFFTLYFIPLIPMGKVGEFVECQTCKGTFIPRVLEFDPNQKKEEVQSVYEQAMRHTMVLIMLADGEIDDKEMEIVLKIINQFGHNDMTSEELESYAQQVQTAQEDISTYLKKVTPYLNEHGKEVIIKCAIAVASADGNIDKSEISLINEMARTMEMSSSHMKGIISGMLEKKPEFSHN